MKVKLGIATQVRTGNFIKLVYHYTRNDGVKSQITLGKWEIPADFIFDTMKLTWEPEQEAEATVGKRKPRPKPVTTAPAPKRL